MKKVLILYGWHGSDAPHWQDWLAKNLQKNGHTVSFPQLSNKSNPAKDIWIKEAKEAFDAIKPDTVIAHSLGNILWMHLCALGLMGEVERLLMVAPPRDLSVMEEVREFFPAPATKGLCARERLMVVSDDDPYINIEESKELASLCECELRILNNAGHINSDSGFGAWPWVLDWAEGGK